MRYAKNAILFLLPCIAIHTYSQTVYIIIHGTWCTPFSWHMPGGHFYEALKASALQHDASVLFLNWSGKNSHQARMHGAQRLMSLIKTYKPDDKINIVAHSHGGNVGILTSQLLAKTEYSIDNFFAMGTPIDLNRYKPNMQKIKTFYNLFSFGDMVQTVGGLYQRELPSAPSVHNIRININAKEPNHCALHDTMLAHLIGLENFWQQLSDTREYAIFFATGIIPELVVDEQRVNYREKNKEHLHLYNDPLRTILQRDFLPSDPKHH